MGVTNPCGPLNIIMDIEVVLDHGYVQFIEQWGSEERIIESARMSTDKGFKGWGPFTCEACVGTGVRLGEGEGGLQRVECDRCKGTGKVPGDEKLLRYLYEHKHLTPFEQPGLTFEIQAPIFVFREWHRHRTQSYNELSARYTPLPDVYYVPSIDRMLQAGQSSTNKQAGDGSLHPETAEDARMKIIEHYRMMRRLYELLLYNGIAREVARVVIPVGQYSRMRASANLRNWLQFLTLRMDPAAQWEIRQYANIVGRLVSERFPRTWELFIETHGT